MSRFFTIEPLVMLCAMMSQATPMVPDSNTQTPDQEISTNAIVFQANTLEPPPVPLIPLPPVQSPLAPISTELPAQQPSQPKKTPVQASPCPPDCKPESQQKSAPQEEKQNTEKKEGWMNGLRNVWEYSCKAMYEFFVGKKGILTTLDYKSRDTRPKKKLKSTNSDSKGNTKICCVCINQAPMVEGEDEEVGDQQSDNESRPIICTLIQNRFSSSSSTNPGAPAPVITPGVPGSKTSTKSAQTNCCCVGEKFINCVKMINVRIKFTLNCCGVVANASAVEGY